MTTKKNITHFQASTETEAQDKFAEAFLAAYAKQSGQPMPEKVDNSAWKPAQPEPQRPHFPFISVIVCVVIAVVALYFGVLQ